MTSTGTLKSHQYPYLEDDLDYDDEEEMETDYQNAPLGGAGDARMAPLANIQVLLLPPTGDIFDTIYPRSNSGITPEHSHRH